MPSKSVESLFISLFELHREPLFRFLLRRTEERELALDLVQESFHKVWMTLAKGDDIEYIKTYLYTTAIHLLIDHKRKKSAVSLDRLPEEFEQATSPADMTDHALDARSAYGMLTQLAAEDRELLLLRYESGFSPREIARLYKQSANVISVRLHRAVKKYKMILKNSDLS